MEVLAPIPMSQRLREIMQKVLDALHGQTAEDALNVLVNMIIYITIQYGGNDLEFVRKFINDHLDVQIAAQGIK
jgi:hypothetical protein